MHRRIQDDMLADDKFILCGASPKLWKYGYSGLQPNLSKSTIFYAGVPSLMRLRPSLTQILGMPEGTLPVKYLGVPLITSGLKYADCIVLKEKILDKIQS